MEKQRLIQMVNDALEVLGETKRITDIVTCDAPDPIISQVPLIAGRKAIVTPVLPIHRQLYYKDLNRAKITMAEAEQLFNQGQPVYVNNQRYEIKK